MPSDLTDTRIFTVNGQEYLVGMDKYGYIQIQTGEQRVNPETEEKEFVAYDKTVDLAPVVMFDSQTAREMAQYIEELVR